MLGMHRFPRPGLSGYPLKVLITCVLVAIVTVVRQLAVSVWDPALPFILFYPVVIVCAWMGGLLIGLLATGLSLVSLMLFLHTHTGIELGQSGSVLSALVTEGIIISFIFDRLLRKLERGYQQRLRHMQTFITEAPAAIAMFDRNMRYIAVSKRWLSDYHLEGQDLLGRSHYEVFPELPQRWKEAHQRGIAGAIERESEELLVRADGSKQWLAWEVRPWRGGADGKEIGGILIFSEDITAMKEAYEQEGAMRAKAEVATALQAEAEKLAKTKDDFVATLSHELRTPLNAMLGWTQLLKKFSNDPYRLVQAMNAIERSGQILTQLISDILDINRIASGKLRLNVSAVAVSSLMEHALNTVTPEIDIKGIALKKYLDVESLMVNCDPVRLQQCVWNLLSNAMKFTPRGGTITVSARAINNQLRISVADTGCGIPPETLPRIFERFVQADTSSTRTHGGLGLGLAIVRHLARIFHEKR
jgi:PAS domain S-box-containing protein